MYIGNTSEWFCALEMKLPVIFALHSTHRKGDLQNKRFARIAGESEVMPVHRAGNKKFMKYSFLEEFLANRNKPG
jgi:hypothetical protein